MNRDQEVVLLSVPDPFIELKVIDSSRPAAR